MMPIKIAGIPISLMGEVTEDYNSASATPICTCVDPLPRIGIPLAYWEPFAVMDVSGIANCLPSIGMYVPLPSLGNQVQAGAPHTGAGHNEAYQATFVKYPLLKMAGMFIDTVCMQTDSALSDIYPTTIDPLWQQDSWSVIATPDALLFTNILAQITCMADSVAANIKFPLDPLYWCMGSWGSVFPLSASNSGVGGAANAMATSGRMLFKMHRQLLLWAGMGSQGLCSKYPMPIMRKSMYGMYPVYPLMTYPYRVPIGRSGMVFGAGANAVGISNHVWTIMLYRKRECCVL